MTTRLSVATFDASSSSELPATTEETGSTVELFENARYGGTPPVMDSDDAMVE